MKIKNTYFIVTKKYPLRLNLARKGLIQLFLRKDFHQYEDDFSFTSLTHLELVTSIYANIWSALEGFIDIVHCLFDGNELDSNGQPKLLAKKISEITDIIYKADSKLINYSNLKNIAQFSTDRKKLKEHFKSISLEINNNTENKSKKKRNSMTHLPVREKVHFSEHHLTLKDSESAKHQFYAFNVIEDHTVYGLEQNEVRRLYDVIDQFILNLVGFIKKHVNDYNISLFSESTDIDSIQFRLTLLNQMKYSEYDEEKMLCSGSQTMENIYTS